VLALILKHFLYSHSPNGKIFDRKSERKIGRFWDHSPKRKGFDRDFMKGFEITHQKGKFLTEISKRV